MNRPLPCPRPSCGSSSISVDSHAATGVILECNKCGAASEQRCWDKGLILLQKKGNGRKPVTEKYERQAQKESK